MVKHIQIPVKDYFRPVISKIFCEIDIFVKDNPPIDKYVEVYTSLALYIIKNQIKGYISNGRFQSLIK